MCASPVLAPHGCPEPPAPAARLSHYQSQPQIHSRHDARAAANLTSTPAPFCALCRICTLLLASHKRLYQDAPRVRRRSGTAQARTHARTRARARARFRSLLHRLPACTHSIQHHGHAYAQRRSPHPTTIARLTPHHAVPRSHRQQPDQRNCSARLCTPAVSLHSEPSQSTPPPRLPGHTAAKM